MGDRNCGASSLSCRRSSHLASPEQRAPRQARTARRRTRLTFRKWNERARGNQPLEARRCRCDLLTLLLRNPTPAMGPKPRITAHRLSVARCGIGKLCHPADQDRRLSSEARVHPGAFELPALVAGWSQKPVGFHSPPGTTAETPFGARIRTRLRRPLGAA